MAAASLNSASAYRGSGKWAADPAPRSIKRRTPAAFSFAAISGTTATRVSLAAVSARTPTTTAMQISPKTGLLCQTLNYGIRVDYLWCCMKTVHQDKLRLLDWRDDLAVVAQGY